MHVRSLLGAIALVLASHVENNERLFRFSTFQVQNMLPKYKIWDANRRDLEGQKDIMMVAVTTQIEQEIAAMVFNCKLLHTYIANAK